MPAPAGVPTADEHEASPAERRLISVLFVDLENFTAIAESLDPEDVRSLQSRYFEAARSIVARYGGALEKFIGDAVMAVWGAPAAHEDDGERAVRAALEVVAAVEKLRGPLPGQRLSARAAVATGEPRERSCRPRDEDEQRKRQRHAHPPSVSAHSPERGNLTALPPTGEVRSPVAA